MSFTTVEKGPDKPDAPALVLLHGIGSAGRSFEHQINAFAPRFKVRLPPCFALILPYHHFVCRN